MDWCCTRCGNRQANEAACARCGEDSVLDLRSRRVRDLLEEIEMRARDRREARIRTIGVVTGMVTVFALWLVPGWWDLRGTLYPGLPLIADQILLMILVALGVIQVLERTLATRRFPFVDELAPPDRD